MKGRKTIGLILMMLGIFLGGCSAETKAEEAQETVPPVAETPEEKNVEVQPQKEEDAETHVDTQETPEERATEVPQKKEEYEKERTETDEEMATGKFRSNGTIEVSVECVDKSVKNKNGDIIGIAYYEKPVLIGDTEAVQRINAFFDGEEEDWFGAGGRITGDQENYYDYFSRSAFSFEEGYGEYMIEHPVNYTVTTRIKYIDENLLSILQVTDVYLGTRGYFYRGTTFDLNTGELLPITELADIDPAGMREIMEDAYTEQSYYDEMVKNDFVFHVYDKEIDMKYEYFYDGNNFYILRNYYEGMGNYNGWIQKWNGKWGEDYEVSGLTYEPSPYEIGKLLVRKW